MIKTFCTLFLFLLLQCRHSLMADIPIQCPMGSDLTYMCNHMCKMEGGIWKGVGSCDLDYINKNNLCADYGYNNEKPAPKGTCYCKCESETPKQNKLTIKKLKL